MLGDTARVLLDRYAGDLRTLREEAGGRPEQERALLKQFKGIGDVGADIFLREVQAVWDEVRPFVDRRARAGAGMKPHHQAASGDRRSATSRAHTSSAFGRPRSHSAPSDAGTACDAGRHHAP
jgi:hypothetical protein